MTEKRTDTEWLCVQEPSLDSAGLIQFVSDERAGAIDVFLGVTRRFTKGRETGSLSYDSYPEMAIAEMEKLLLQCRDRFSVLKAGIHHRTGEVGISEASVVIAVSAPHRAQAIDAVRFLIDELKESVPIWKKEQYADGSQEWVHGDASTGAE